MGVDFKNVLTTTLSHGWSSKCLVSLGLILSRYSLELGCSGAFCPGPTPHLFNTIVSLLTSPNFCTIWLTQTRGKLAAKQPTSAYLAFSLPWSRKSAPRKRSSRRTHARSSPLYASFLNSEPFRYTEQIYRT